MSELEFPADVSPALFFEEWLPTAVAREYSRGRRFAAIPVHIALEGEGGGAWNLRVDKGELQLSKGKAAQEPLVTVTQAVADWRATLVPEAGAIALRPPRSSPLDILFVDPGLRQLLGATHGTVRLEVSGYNGRTWSLTLKIGDQPFPIEPDAALVLSAETFARLVDKSLLPPEAYFGGLVQIRGNADLAMQLALAILPRFLSSPTL